MHGGNRKGAGRKAGFAAKQAEEARKYISERVFEEIEILTEVLIKRAKNGDLKALQMLFDRAWGRPKQEIGLATNYATPAPSQRLLDLAKRLNESVHSL